MTSNFFESTFQKVAKNLNVGDSTIFNKLGLERMQDTHTAYPIQIDGQNLAIIIGTNITRHQLQDLSEEDARNSTVVFKYEINAETNAIESPRVIWPEPTPLEENQKRVLVVEDDSDVCDYIKEILADNGFQAMFAGNGIEGITKFYQQNIDLIISDINMPILDGLAMAAKLNADLKNTPLIILSGNITQENIAKGLQSGVTKWLVKPFDASQFIEAVTETLNSKA